MFGLNAPEPPVRHHDGQQLDIVEIFETIQGEGPYSGLRATFIRLAGCHLQCYFCDTDFTSNRMMLTLNEIRRHVMGYAPTLVVLTGGEPLRQNIVPLCRTLAKEGFHVQIETAGSFWPEGEAGSELAMLIVSNRVSIVVSPKTRFVHDKISELAMAWKYIVTASGSMMDDGLPITSTQDPTRRTTLARPPAAFPNRSVFLQPCDYSEQSQRAGDRHIPAIDNEHLVLKEMALNRAVGLCKKHGFRLSVQLHKIIGLP